MFATMATIDYFVHFYSAKPTFNSFLRSTLPKPQLSHTTLNTASRKSNQVQAVRMASDEGNTDDVLVQYVVMRRDLIDSWPMGSVITQGCHASVAAVWMHKEDHDTIKYCGDENLDKMHKVTLEVKGEAQLVNLSEKLKGGEIGHKLWIEQPENIPTCLATKPYPKTLVAPFFRKLKLCK